MTISFTTARRLPTNAAVVAYGIKSDELGNLPACFSSTELKKLGFDIPPIEYTHFNTSEVNIYRHLWKEKKIFDDLPTDGIILKVNSRKLQKLLGESNKCIHWTYAITS